MINMKKQILSTLLLLMTTTLMAQLAPEEGGEEPEGIEAKSLVYFKSNAYGGDLIIHQTSEIEELVGLRMAILEKQKGFEGYRIRMFAQVGRGARDKANQFRVSFEESHQDIDAYLVYNNPNWEVHIGNFRDRFEAKHCLEKFRKEYPEAFIVKSIVKFPDLKTKTDEPSGD
jgi:hypothetical protein